jgi:AcrR family transcriptional regulator
LRVEPTSARAASKGKRAPVANARAALQRERILDAAERCFIQSGFHGASMADVAATAGMSAGLIYRYFDSKSAIVKAIIERHIESDECKAIGLNSVADVTEGILEIFERWRRGDDPKFNPVLILELSAEATRDPKIAHAVRSSDQIIGNDIAQAVRQCAQTGGVTLTAVAARSRAVVLQCLIEGLAMRVVRDPKLRRGTLKPALERIISALMS